MIGTQTALPGLIGRMSNSRYNAGALGEGIVAQSLEKRGYKVATNHKRGDLEIFGVGVGGRSVFIEVKTARISKDKKYRFTLVNKGTDHRDAHLVILLCVLKTGDCVPFVVPVSALYNQRQAVITSFPTAYAGKLAKYRQSLRTISLEAAIREMFE